MKWIAVLYLQLTSVFLNVVIPFGVDAFVTRTLAGRSRSTTNIRETILDENDPFELPDPRWICPLQADVCVETGVTLSRYSTLQANRKIIQSINEFLSLCYFVVNSRYIYAIFLFLFSFRFPICSEGNGSGKPRFRRNRKQYVDKQYLIVTAFLYCTNILLLYVL